MNQLAVTFAVAPELASAWSRYERWATLCTVRRCAYTDLAGELAAPPWRGRDVEEVCPGYAGFLHVTEHEPQLIRVRNCARKQAWSRRRQDFIRAERKKQRERDKALRNEKGGS
jgi:5-methylcytosine-specific restriction endonuclease McrA